MDSNAAAPNLTTPHAEQHTQRETYITSLESILPEINTDDPGVLTGDGVPKVAPTVASNAALPSTTTTKANGDTNMFQHPPLSRPHMPTSTPSAPVSSIAAATSFPVRAHIGRQPASGTSTAVPPQYHLTTSAAIEKNGNTQQMKQTEQYHNQRSSTRSAVRPASASSVNPSSSGVQRLLATKSLDIPHFDARVSAQMRYIETACMSALSAHTNSVKKIFMDLLHLQLKLPPMSRYHLLYESEQSPGTNTDSSIFTAYDLFSLFSPTISTETRDRRDNIAMIGEVIADFKLLCTEERVRDNAPPSQRVDDHVSRAFRQQPSSVPDDSAPNSNAESRLSATVRGSSSRTAANPPSDSIPTGGSTAHPP